MSVLFEIKQLHLYKFVIADKIDNKMYSIYIWSIIKNDN